MENRQAHMYETRNPLVRYYVYARVNAILNEIRPDDVVLDVGHAEGYLTALIAKEAKRVVGVDNHEPARSVALLNAKDCGVEDKVTLFLVDITDEEYPFEDEFDAIVCSEILEHVDHPKSVFRHLLSFLKKGGRFIITIPNERNLYLGRKIMFPFRADEIEDVTDHKTEITVKELEGYAQEFNMKITKCRDLPFPILDLNKLIVMEKA